MNIQEELVLNVIERLTKIYKIQKLYMLSWVYVYSWSSSNPLKLLWIVWVLFVVNHLSSVRYLVHGKWMPRYQYRRDRIQYVHFIRGNSVHTVFLLSVTHSLKRYSHWTIHRNIKYNTLLEKVAIIFRLPHFIRFSRKNNRIELLSYQSLFFSFFILLLWFVVKC